MSKADGNKHSNTNALRADDIVPPYNKAVSQKRISQNKQTRKRETVSSQNQQKQPPEKELSQIVLNKAKRAEELSVEPVDAVQQTNEIPKFDLAEQILAEQRKIASVRRKGPIKRHEAPKQEQQVESIGLTIKPPILSEQEQIIAQIVARDIEKLCRGNTLNTV